jgi:hypothetical protein
VSRAASAVREARYRKRELDALAAADAAEKDINKDWGLIGEHAQEAAELAMSDEGREAEAEAMASAHD